ncbi:WD40-repeat-containing domain protein [Pelagophyceae sp. CCMP2097]|nr:WD40-repeat-containing domain protein [Pelagophyceae sp. CCMP2097]
MPFDPFRTAPAQRGAPHSDAPVPPQVFRLPDLEGHADVVTDLLVLAQPRDISGPARPGAADEAGEGEGEGEGGLLVTASLDRTVKLWALPSRECVCTLEGHTAGVRALAYDAKQHVLFSAGFEVGVRAWGITGIQAFPLFTLEGGHATSVRHVHAAPGSACALVSLDDAGTVCWWNTARDSDCTPGDRLTNLFRMAGDHCGVVAAVGYGVDLVKATRGQRERAEHRSRTDAPEQEGVGALGALGMDEANADLAMRAVAWSSNAISLACGGRRGVLRLYDASDARPAEEPPALLSYSPLTREVASVHGAEVKLWDATTGLLSRAHALRLGPKGGQHVAGLAFDSRGRRLIVADRAGGVSVVQARDARTLVEFEGHAAEAAALAYSAADRVVVTVGWDRQVRIYDEAEGAADALLRRVANAHAADLTGVKLARDLGLVATAAADATLRLWDFESLHLDATVRVVEPPTCFEFFEPYPLLVLCDARGFVSLVPLVDAAESRGGGQAEHAPALRFPNGGPGLRGGGSAALALGVRYDVSGGAVVPGTTVRRGRALVYTGDVSGDIQVFDVKPALDKIGIGAVSSTDVRWRQPGYNARRRVQRDHANSGFQAADDPEVHKARRASRTSRDGRHASAASAADAPRVMVWAAHTAAVTAILLVGEPERLLTAGADGSIKCWDPATGEPLGVLTRGRDEDARALRLLAAPHAAAPATAAIEWRFFEQGEFAAHRARGRQATRDVLAEVLETKRAEVRALAAKRELVAARRQVGRQLTTSLLADAESRGGSAAADAESRGGSAAGTAGRARGRLFGQLRGEETWTLSEFDKVKAEAKASSVTESSKAPRKAAVGENALDDTAADAAKAQRLLDEEKRRDVRKNELRQDADDPANWGVGSTNRERAMYGHLHVELGARQRASAGRNKGRVKPPGVDHAERAKIAKLIELSPFLKQHLGPRAAPPRRASAADASFAATVEDGLSVGTGALTRTGATIASTGALAGTDVPLTRSGATLASVTMATDVEEPASRRQASTRSVRSVEAPSVEDRRARWQAGESQGRHPLEARPGLLGDDDAPLADLPVSPLMAPASAAPASAAPASEAPAAAPASVSAELLGSADLLGSAESLGSLESAVEAAEERALLRSVSAPLGRQSAPLARQARRALSPVRPRTPGSTASLPRLTSTGAVVADVHDKIDAWKDRVLHYANLAAGDASPRGYVYKTRPPLFLRGADRSATPKLAAPRPARRVAPLESASSSGAGPPRRRLRPSYGPYPAQNIRKLVSAYKSLLPAGTAFGAPVPLAAVAAHKTVDDNAYFRAQASQLGGDATRAAGQQTISPKALLRAFFPLLRASDVAELHAHFLKKAGVSPWLHEDTRARAEADDDSAAAPEAESRAELRALFDLFDVERCGSVPVADVDAAVGDAGAAGVLGEALPNWPALRLALRQRTGALLTADAAATLDVGAFVTLVRAAIAATEGAAAVSDEAAPTSPQGAPS